MLNSEEQAALERIRSTYGSHDIGASQADLAGYSNNISGAGEGNGRDNGASEYAGLALGTSGAVAGTYDSPTRREVEQDGNLSSGLSEDYSGTPSTVRSGAPGASTGTERGSWGAIKIKGLGKPSGLAPSPSFAEQREREREVPATSQPEIIKVLRTTKDGKRSQVMFKNPNGGRPLWGWIDNAPTTTQDAQQTAQKGKVVVDNTQKVQTPPAASETLKKASGPGLPKIRRGIMTAAEAESSREELEGALIEGFELLDKLIINTTKGHPQGLAIWSDMDDADISRLANWRLAAAQRSERAAVAVRGMIAMREQVQIGLILVPRFWKTWKVYMEWGIEIPGAPLRQRKALRA